MISTVKISTLNSNDNWMCMFTEKVIHLMYYDWETQIKSRVCFNEFNYNINKVSPVIKCIPIKWMQSIKQQYPIAFV